MVNNDKKRTLGALVDSRMREKGLESKHLAKKLNVTPQAVNKWRRGDAIPSSDTLPKLAAELGLSVDELLYRRASSDREQGGEAPGKQNQIANV